MFRILHNNRGIALLVTILIISLILVMTLRFNTSMRSSLTSASNLQNNIALDYVAQSIFNAARAILSVDASESNYDDLHEDWANVALASQYFSYFFQRGQGTIKIQDHSGRLQVNSLLVKNNDEWVVNEAQKDLWLNLLSADEFQLGEEGAAAVVEAVIDWIDPDDEAMGFGGAESSYYQGLATPYTPRNGPMEFIEELLLVRGITQDLYYGTGEYPGLATLVTTYGNDGKVNINTAPPLVLGALSALIEPEMVEALVAYRDYEDTDLSNPKWYKSAPGFPGDIIIPPELITTQSTYFEIVSEVYEGKVSKTVTGMVARGSGSKTHLLSWKTD
ncbi:MAG: type II secretion system minor pseudopilin GspK [Desulfobulbales bacterium]